MTPGSMPPFSSTIDEEGVLIQDALIVETDALREAAIRALLAQGPLARAQPGPERGRPAAQVAACTRGAEELRPWSRSSACAAVRAYMGHVQDNAEEARAPRGDRRARPTAPSRTRWTTARRSACASRSTARRARRRSTSPAPARSGRPTSTRRRGRRNAAVLYVFRTLVDARHPAERGLPAAAAHRRPRRLDAEPAAPGCRGRRQRRDHPGHHRRAVWRSRRARGIAGHDEQFHLRQRRATSTTRRSAAAPARDPDFDGASAVQTHMTNSRLTDPEVLEWRFPGARRDVRDPRGSGGAGRHRGGDGVAPPRALPRADDGRDPLQPPARAAVRRGGRQGGRARAQLRRARGRRASRRSGPRTRSTWQRATCS